MQPPVPQPTAPTADAAATPRRRIDGIDLARGLAIVGMVTVHVAPPLAGQAGGLYGAAYGRASALFALVAGLGIALSSRRGPIADHRARLAWRAAWLWPVGLVLTGLGTPVAVILQYYAVWFLLAIPVLRWSTRRLAAVTAVGILLGPAILVWARAAHPEWYVAGRGQWLGEVGDVLLTGYYPTVSWIWLVYAGMLLTRLDLQTPRVQVWLTGGGALLALGVYAGADAAHAALDLGRWQSLLLTRGHSDTPAEQLATLGVAVAVLGVCLLLGTYLRPLVAPGVALGRFALTVYVGHLLVYAAAPELLFNDSVAGGTVTTLWITGVSTVVAVVWLQFLPRGPLEALDRAGHERLVVPLLRLVRGERT